MAYTSGGNGDSYIVKDTIISIDESCRAMRQAVQAMNYLSNPNTVPPSQFLNDLDVKSQSSPLTRAALNDIKDKNLVAMFRKVSNARPDMSTPEAMKLAQELQHKLQVDPDVNQRLVSEIIKDMEKAPRVGDNLPKSSIRLASQTSIPGAMQKAVEKAVALRLTKYPAMSRQTLISLIYDLYEKLSDPNTADQVEDQLRSIATSDVFVKSAKSSLVPLLQGGDAKKSAHQIMLEDAFNQRMSAKETLMNRDKINMGVLEKTIRFMTRLKSIYPDWSNERLLLKLSEIYTTLSTGVKSYQQWEAEIPPPTAPIYQKSSFPKQSLPLLLDDVPRASMFNATLGGAVDPYLLDIAQAIMEAVRAIRGGIGQLQNTVEDVKVIDEALKNIPSPDLTKLIEKTEKARLKMDKMKLQSSTDERSQKIEPKQKVGTKGKDSKSQLKGVSSEEYTDTSVLDSTYSKEIESNKYQKSKKKSKKSKDAYETDSSSYTEKDKKKSKNRKKGTETSSTDVAVGKRKKSKTDVKGKPTSKVPSKEEAKKSESGVDKNVKSPDKPPAGVNTVVKAIAPVDNKNQSPSPPISPQVPNIRPQANQSPVMRPPPPPAPRPMPPPRPSPPPRPQPIQGVGQRGGPPPPPGMPLSPPQRMPPPMPSRPPPGARPGPQSPRLPGSPIPVNQQGPRMVPIPSPPGQSRPPGPMLQSPQRPPPPPMRPSPPLGAVRSSPQQNITTIPRAPPMPPGYRGPPNQMIPGNRSPPNQMMPGNRGPPNQMMPGRGQAPPMMQPNMMNRGPTPPRGMPPSPPIARMPPAPPNQRMIPPRAPPSTPRAR